MNLTRAQWEEMWKSIKMIQEDAEFVFRHSSSTRIKHSARLILNEIQKIKDKIQQVIGQME